MSKKKYTLVKSDTVTKLDGRKLFRIKAAVAIGAIGVAKGDLGGYIESEANLSVSGNAWVSGDARVYGNAQVYGDAWVHGDARVHGNAQVYGDARVYGNARVHGNAQVYGDARVYGNAQVYGINLTATRSDNYTFLVAPTPEGPRIIAGCRYFTFEEAEKHWSETRGGTPLGDESLSIVAHLKRMAEINGFMEPVARDLEALAAFRKEKGL